MAPITVLHLVEDMRIGGLEKVLASIVLHLDKNRFRPEVWCLAHGGEMAEELIRQGVTVRILHLTTYYNALNILRLAMLMRDKHFHILHTHGYYGSTFGRLSSLLAHVPIILTHVHSTYYNYTKRNLIIEKMLSSFTDKIICVSRAVQSFVTETEKFSEEKTCVLYNGVAWPTANVPPDDALLLKSRLGIGNQELVLTVVASLTTIKGHAILFQALHHLSPEVPPFKLMVVGDGPERYRLESLAKDLGIASRVIFTGARNDVPKLLMISDIFILPSIEREGLSMGIIEAMAAGLPVISTWVGGIPEVVENGTSGLLVEPKNILALADALCILMRDRDLREQMGKVGKDVYLKHFTLKNMMDNLETLYERLVREKNLCLSDR